MDLTQVPDKDLRDEQYRRDRIEREKHEQEMTGRYRREREQQEAKDREFATSIGITHEQYEEAESYVREKVYAEQ